MDGIYNWDSRKKDKRSEKKKNSYNREKGVFTGESSAKVTGLVSKVVGDIFFLVC